MLPRSLGPCLRAVVEGAFSRARSAAVVAPDFRVRGRLVGARAPERAHAERDEEDENTEHGRSLTFQLDNLQVEQKAGRSLISHADGF